MQIVDILHLPQQDPETVNDRLYTPLLYSFSAHH